jgi:hypothetical protein
MVPNFEFKAVDVDREPSERHVYPEDELALR